MFLRSAVAWSVFSPAERSDAIAKRRSFERGPSCNSSPTIPSPLLILAVINLKIISKASGVRSDILCNVNQLLRVGRRKRIDGIVILNHLPGISRANNNDLISHETIGSYKGRCIFLNKLILFVTQRQRNYYLTFGNNLHMLDGPYFELRKARPCHLLSNLRYCGIPPRRLKVLLKKVLSLPM